jgi:hypothetical protein
VEKKALRPGELVRVRTAREILDTLDGDGAVEGIPFMPEMIRYIDKQLHVSNRVEKICWYTSESCSRHLPSTVLLEDLRCDGKAHGGCQAECRIYWKDAWVERVEAGTPERHSDEASIAELRELVNQKTRAVGSSEHGDAEVFRCQITESVKSSTPLAVRDWSQYTAEVRNGNVGIARFLRVAVSMTILRFAHRLGRNPGMPKPAGAGRVDGEKLALQAGDVVEVRSLKEIGATLDDNLKHRGLSFSEEMSPACGKRFRVKNRVERLIDERSGKMIELKNDCIVLDGFICKGDRSPGALFCPREAYPLFREAWLRRVDDRGAVAQDAADAETARRAEDDVELQHAHSRQ